MAERSNSPSSGSAHGSDRPYGLNIAKILQENGFSTIMSEFIDKSLFGDEIDDLATATKTQLCTHMAAHLLVYKDKFFDDELLRNFRMDFDGWTYKMFNQMGLFKKDFRSLFEHQGIKVPIMRNDASAMVALLTGYENKDTAIKTWTGEEIEDRLNMNLFHPRAMLRQRMARNTIRSPGASTPVSSTPVNHQQTVQLGTPLVQQNQPAQQNQLVQQTQPAQQSQPPPVSLQPMTSIPTTIQQNVAPPVQQQTSMVPSTPTVIQQNTPTVQPQTQQQRISTPYTDPQSQRNTYLVPPQGRYLTPLPFRQYTTIPSDTRIVTNVPLSQGNPDAEFWQLPPAETLPERLHADLISKFTKMYQKDDKYTGEPYDLLDDKVTIMLSLCNTLEIPRSGFHAVFPLMLKDRAKQYFISKIHPENSFATMYAMIQTHFDTEVNMKHYNADWTTMTFESIRRDNPSDHPREALRKMLDKFQLCQRAMKLVDPKDQQLRQQVLRAVQHTPQFRPVHFQPHPTFEILCSELRQALEVAINIGTSDQHMTNFVGGSFDDDDDEPNAHYYDRRFSNNRGTQRSQFSNSSSRNSSNNFRRDNNGYQRGNSQRRFAKKCLVCHKVGCWSTKHPKQERDKIRRQYMTECDRHDDKPSREGYATYLIDYEGVDDGNWSDGDDPSPQDEPTQFLQQSAYYHMAGRSRTHQLTHIDVYEEPVEKLPPSQFYLNQYDMTTFHGIMPDTGAAKLSSAGEGQVHAYMHAFPGTSIDPTTAGQNRIKFGSGDPIDSLGTINVNTTFGNILFHVMPTPTPFLLSIADMDRLGIELHNTKNIVCQSSTGKTAPIIRKWGHPWFHLTPSEIQQTMFTESELRQLHRRFGHPETDRLYKLLTKAGHDDVDHKILENISKFCHQCQMHSATPKRFKFTLRDDREFNFEILADVMYLDGKPVLHVIDVGTSFQGASFLKEMSAKETWETLRRIWIDTYLGPPDVITHDAGTNFASKEFKSEAKIMGITCKEVPVEAHWSIGKLERYHAPLRRAWEIISTDLRGICSPQAILQMAIKAVNDTAGPDGLVPTLLVFGSYPRISFDSPPSATTVQRAAAMNKAMKALRQKTADRSVRDALNTRNGPNVSHILDLPLGSLVRVYREKNGWTGPYKLISIDNHDVTVDTGHGSSKFRTTTVQPYFHEDDEPIPDPELSDKDDFSEDEDEFIPVLDDEKPVTTGKRGRGRPKGSKNKPKITEEEITVQLQSTFVQFFPKEENETMMSEKEHHNMELAKQLRTQGKITSPGEPFQMSDETEIKNLIDNGVFAFEQYNDKTHGKARLFSSRMVREIKYDSDNEPYEKSRLVVQGYSDEGKKEILTQSPTIQRASQRIILALSPSIRKLVDADVYLRDITQAYTQSKVPLIRKIYARLPKELINKYPPNTIMVVIRPLYGLAEAGLLWFFTYHSHHLDVLKMNTSTFDPCLLITDPARADKDCFAVVGMQTDDTLFIGTPAFHTLENNVLVYKAKDVSKLTPDTPLNFNGCRTSTDGTSFSVFQKGQGKRLATIPASGDDRKDIYVQQRARGAYIASICQPEASYDLSRAAQNTEPEDSDYTELNKRLQWQIDNQDRGLKFVPLDLSTAAIYVFVDGSFANNKDLSSQIGYLICIGNEKKVNDAFTLKSNIVHWSSTKCKRVTRSVLASEIYGMVSGFDMAFCITQTTNQIIDSLRSVCDVNIGTIPLILCTDSYSLYEGVTKLGTTAEKRLMIDIMALRESYEAKEITEVRWINGHDNPADAMTKANPNKALEKMVSTNEVTIRVEGMVTRKAKTS